MKETRTKTNKRNAFFVEIIIIILFFSLSVVISLELFVQGHLKSELSEQKNMALIRAQSAAERLEGWDPATVQDFSALLSGSKALADQKGCSIFYDSQWNPSEDSAAVFELTARFREEETGAGRMVTMQICVIKLANETAEDPLASFETGYYLAQP